LLKNTRLPTGSRVFLLTRPTERPEPGWHWLCQCRPILLRIAAAFSKSVQHFEKGHPLREIDIFRFLRKLAFTHDLWRELQAQLSCSRHFKLMLESLLLLGS
jgi:hypothetical protein